VLVDTDILIEVARGRNERVASRWTELRLSGGPVLYSPVTAAEIWAGARPDEHAMLNRIFDALTCADAGDEIGRRAGAYLRQYRGSHGFEVPDAVIAATAALAPARLWTRNRKHYPMKDVSFFD
jgi:predicted nucleic acid-binding protein